MKSLTRRVAEFCKRPNGATGNEIAEHFNISAEEAKYAMRTIRKGDRYKHTECKDGHRTRIRVIEIKKAVYHCTPVIAKNIITGDEHKFESLGDADSRGGFTAASIRKCLRGEQSSYAGHYWRRA